MKGSLVALSILILCGATAEANLVFGRGSVFDKAGRYISKQTGFGPAVDKGKAAATSADAAAHETKDTMTDARSLIRAITLPVTFAAWFLPVLLAFLTLQAIRNLFLRNPAPAQQMNAPLHIAPRAPVTNVPLRRPLFWLRFSFALAGGIVIGQLAPAFLAPAFHAPVNADGEYEINETMMIACVIVFFVLIFLILRWFARSAPAQRGS